MRTSVRLMEEPSGLTSVAGVPMILVMGMVRRSLAAILVCFAFALSAHCDARAANMPGPLNDFRSRLATFSLGAPGHVGVVVQDLTTGVSTGINASANMPAASIIKIPVMVEVFRQMSLGTFDLNRKITLTRSDRDWGWGDLASAPGGARYTVSRLLWLMITDSDNTATNMLIRLVGRAHINTTMLKLGLHQTRVGDYLRSNGDIRSLRSSPRDMAKLLSAMAHDELVNEWSSREMINILTGQHHNGLLPQPLPAGTQIAHKTGTLHDTLNDVGIVFLGSEPYVIAVMTTQLPTLDAGRRFIRGVSRLAYTSFEHFLHIDAMPSLTPALQLAPDVQMWTPLTPVAEPVAPDPDAATPAPSPTP
jgi:beta-lactamase class A